jgi:hypothetical protein
MADFLVRFLGLTRQRRQWKWSTLATKLANIAGAMAALPCYIPGMAPIALSHDPSWKRAVKKATRAAATEPSDQAPPIAIAEVERICKNNPEQAAHVALMWVAAARPGCVLQLQAEDVAMTANGDLSITFRRGKAVQLRGQPYTVHTQYRAWSIRRGALQALADKGETPTVLMSFSGHSKVETLMKYLAYGRLLRAVADSARPAARRALAQQVTEPGSA